MREYKTMSSSDTPDLDAKKSDTGASGAIRPADIKNFAISLAILIVAVVAYFCMSGVNLYMSKLAQANLLPTDIHCEPYASAATADIATVISNIFGPFNTRDVPGATPQTMHMRFDTQATNPAEHVLIAPLRRLSESPTSHFLAVYFADILKSMLCFNNGALNMYYNMLNYIPESMGVAISPVTTGVFFALLMMANLIYFVYTWFKSMGAFFQAASEDNGTRETIDLISSPLNTLIAWGFVVLFIFILFLVIAVVPLFNVGIVGACFATALGGYKAAYVDAHGNTNKEATVWQVVSDTFKYHKTLIAWIFALLYTLVTFTNLGTVAAIVTVVLIIILFVTRAMDFFVTTAPDGQYLGPVIANVKQATRTCNPKEGRVMRAARGWLGAFIDLFKTPAAVAPVAQQAANPRGGGTTGITGAIPLAPEPVLDKRFLKALRGGMRATSAPIYPQ